MARRSMIENEIDQLDESDPVLGLVRDYLSAEADTVDGQAILERVRQTRRRKRLLRQAGLLAVAAAVVAVLVVAYMVAAPKAYQPTDDRQIVINPPHDSREPLNDLTTLAQAARSPIDDVLSAVAAPFDGAATPDVTVAISETKESLAADASHVKGKVTGIVADSLVKAGLFL